MDAAGFFEEPVTEDLAPGYSKVIKHPMCFQVGGLTQSGMKISCISRKIRVYALPTRVALAEPRRTAYFRMCVAEKSCHTYGKHLDLDGPQMNIV